MLQDAPKIARGHGKAGGIRFAKDPGEAEREAAQLFRAEIKGCEITKILVEEKFNIVKELYLSVTIDVRAHQGRN